MDTEPHNRDLGALFGKDASRAERVKALRAFSTTASARLQGVSSAAGRGTEAMAERSAHLLSELVIRLPVRGSEALNRECGADPEQQVRHVIDDAAKLAGRLWTAAAALPGPPPLVHAVRVILHSAIEIRMIGELYAIHAPAASDRDATWLATILLAWANGQPVAPVAAGGPVASGAVVLVERLRQSATDLVRGDSRLASVANRGREGSATIRRLGERMHRRMRPHPSTWARPESVSTKDMLIGAAAEHLRSRVPGSMVTLAERGVSSGAREPSPPIAAHPGPREALAAAWALHHQAAADSGGLSTSDPVGGRLSIALAAQRTHLQSLSRRLGQAEPPMPARRLGPDLVRIHVLAGQTEDAIDAVEEIGARPRRLSSWSSRGRAAFIYLLTAVVVSTPSAVALWSSSGAVLLTILAVQLLVSPGLTLGIGAIVIGPLFRPRLGGPVPRHPVVGGLVALGVHLGVGVAVTVLSRLL